MKNNTGTLISRSLLIIFIIYFVAGSCRKPSNPSVPGDTNKYSACFEGGSKNTLDIVTFNVELFPMNGYETIAELAILIEAMNADIIALQEISSAAEFSKLDDLLEDYTGIDYLIENSSWNLAYLYRHSEISIDATETKLLFDDDFWAFPRPPFEIHARHIPSSTDLIVINNHLKCCGGTDNEDRRRSASEQLHTYINTNYPDEAVVVLGDLNDDIDGETESSNVFWDFVNDPSSYAVADMDIAKGSSLWWSYKDWPSHIDHIIISDELFDIVDTCMTLKADACYVDFSSVISDHRPVYLRLK